MKLALISIVMAALSVSACLAQTPENVQEVQIKFAFILQGVQRADRELYALQICSSSAPGPHRQGPRRSKRRSPRAAEDGRAEGRKGQGEIQGGGGGGTST